MNIINKKSFKLPPGFEVISLKKGMAVIKSECQTWLKEGLDSLAKPEKTPEIKHLGGRGNSFSFPVSDPQINRIVVRPYKRGGFLTGPLLRNIYWGVRRFLQELEVSVIAFNKGLPVSEPLGIVLEPKALGFYKAFILSKEITGAKDISTALESLKRAEPCLLSRKKQELLKALVAAIVRFHNGGIYHPDLHLKNILVRENPSGLPEIFIIDLDRAKYYNSLRFSQRVNNLVRLNRSIIKLGLDKIITASDRLRFLESYLSLIGQDNPQLVRSISQRCERNVRLHRAGWRLRRE